MNLNITLPNEGRVIVLPTEGSDLLANGVGVFETSEYRLIMILAAVVVEESLNSGRLHKKDALAFCSRMKSKQTSAEHFFCLLFVQNGGMLGI
jgi:hypothetical protein